MHSWNIPPTSKKKKSFFAKKECYGYKTKAGFFSACFPIKSFSKIKLYHMHHENNNNKKQKITERKCMYCSTKKWGPEGRGKYIPAGGEVGETPKNLQERERFCLFKLLFLKSHWPNLDQEKKGSNRAMTFEGECYIRGQISLYEGAPVPLCLSSDYFNFTKISVVCLLKWPIILP